MMFGDIVIILIPRRNLCGGGQGKILHLYFSLRLIGMPYNL